MTPSQRALLDSVVSEIRIRWESSWSHAVDDLTRSSTAEVSAWVERDTVRGVNPADLDQRFHLAANRAE